MNNNFSAIEQILPKELGIIHLNLMELSPGTFDYSKKIKELQILIKK